MTVRLTSRLLVSAMIRSVEGLGGHAAVLAKGDETAGAIVIALAERGRALRLLERSLGPDGDYRWAPCGPEPDEEGAAVRDYIARRRGFDPDLWVVELDLPDAEAILDDMGV
ncbi:MAG: DUF1491 family protein [Sphingomonadaceae bacterium]|nr:DUF1491 family protein [Sphingomonadaceae bacterium]